MSVLGNGLGIAGHNEDALSVKEAELALKRRLGASEHDILIVQGNIANTYAALRRDEEALSMRHEVYSGHLKLNGEEHYDTIREADNYALSLIDVQRYAEAKALLRKTTPVARRVLGEGHRITLKMRWNYAEALYNDPDATLDDLREAVTTLEDAKRIAWRVFGGVHPLTVDIEAEIRDARAALRAREPK
jgi:tetratricopeptide (TPR) repeat protein